MLFQYMSKFTLVLYQHQVLLISKGFKIIIKHNNAHNICLSLLLQKCILNLYRDVTYLRIVYYRGLTHGVGGQIAKH